MNFASKVKKLFAGGKIIKGKAIDGSYHIHVDKNPNLAADIMKNGSKWYVTIAGNNASHGPFKSEKDAFQFARDSLIG
jgi:hypothetical protein